MKKTTTAVLAFLPLALAACGSSTASGGASGTTAPASAAPAQAAFSPAQSKFVKDLAAALAAKGEASTVSEAKTVTTGEAVCTARKSGAAQSSVSDGTATDTMIVRLAEKDLCPAYLPEVLLRMSGSGIKNSAPFQVTDKTLVVKYSYDCADDGGSGNFIADLTDGSDDQSIANALSSGGSDSTTVYPTDQDADYHVAVNSECSWALTVMSG